MARRIITAYLREKIYAADREEEDRKYGPLKIDLPVTLDWTWDGDERKCRVLRAGFDQFDWDHVIGEVVTSDDTEWLRQATITEHNATIRVHELGLYENDTHRKMFRFEVLTGQDHDVLVAERRQREWIEFAKQHWWKFGLALAAFYWWLS